MKVCIIELIQKGGMVYYVSQLANALSRDKNVTVHLIVPEGIEESLFGSNLIIHKIPTMGRHPFRFDVLFKTISKIRPDVLHITIRHPSDDLII